MSAPVDAVVVGAGPAGAIVAKRLAEEGCRVVGLEQGDWPVYAGDRAGEDRVGALLDRDWLFFPPKRDSAADYPIDDSAADIAPIMWSGVGGGSVVYAAQWTRSLASDFRVRSRDGVADDWPIDYAELEPFYRRVEREFGVSGHPGDPAYPAGNDPPLPAAPLREGGERMARTMDGLGWHWWPGSNAIATRRHGRQGACVQLGICSWGCPVRSKGSVDVTHWPDALTSGVRLIVNARAQRIETDAAGRCTGVSFTDPDGGLHFQAADQVVLAANGVGTPRLLLQSGGGAGDGLANGSGLVGRRLMMHPFATVTGVFDEHLGTDRGVWGHLLVSFEHYETDERRGFVRGAKWGLVPTGGPAIVVREYPWGSEKIWGDGFQETVKRRLGHSMTWGIIAEDLPDAENLVALDTDRKDAAGFAGVKVRYRTSENTDRLLAYHRAQARESMLAAGAEEIVVAPLLRESGWHLLGTARMGDDPADSVVDRWGRTHEVDNLYVVDGSVFPTSTGVNPTATVAAFALRTAEHMLETRGARR